MSIFSHASLCYYINLKFFTHQDNICYIENVLREGSVLPEPKEIINSISRHHCKAVILRVTSLSSSNVLNHPSSTPPFTELGQKTFKNYT